VDRTDSRPTKPVGLLADDHELSARARRYGERVVSGSEWPLDAVDCGKITWATSTRAKRRHGRCSYDGDGQVTITLTEHTYERAGFAACKTTIRHELVHAWQYQNRGRQAIATDGGVRFLTHSDAEPTAQQYSDHTTTTASQPTQLEATEGFTIETGHGDCFRAWVDPLELPGRCSRYYDRRRADFAYVYACPDCGNWWGKHRLCKSVRQAAHGGEGSSGYRYCTDCEVLLHLQVGDYVLAHGDHADEAIRAFVDGEFASTADAAETDADADIELPLLAVDAVSGTDRPA